MTVLAVIAASVENASVFFIGALALGLWATWRRTTRLRDRVEALELLLAAAPRPARAPSPEPVVEPAPV
ncbi:MAG TPA: hypothetical protein VJZ76_01020, partial [Thermoanaerobaculia bacterium]|nr:hypothetical protein [Thermoanaerobaculia bacterium]